MVNVCATKASSRTDQWTLGFAMAREVIVLGRASGRDWSCGKSRVTGVFEAAETPSNIDAESARILRF